MKKTILFFLLLHSTYLFSQVTYQTPIDPESRSINTSKEVGVIHGAANVSPTGAATYQIPISVTPGTAGMQPSISVVYNSQGGNGILGMGWDIAGLSAITRIPQTYYSHGTIAGGDLSSNDRFALDGNRLVEYQGTAYGADGYIYYTEIETFSKIVSYGTAGTGPSYFIVQTKDGKTVEYGNTTDSKIEANGSSTVLLWRINKITDENGNYMTFTYNESQGESNISRISYTGNTITGWATYNSLEFIYNTRQDISKVFIGGTSLSQTKLLTEIQAKNGSTLVRSYDFKYSFDDYSHLNEIVESGSDGTELNSTIVEWGESNENFNETPSGLIYIDINNIEKFYGDFNGDGKTDFFYIPKKTSYTTSDIWEIKYAALNGAAFSHLVFGNLKPKLEPSRIKTGDFTGDGIDDFFLAYLDDSEPSFPLYKYEFYESRSGLLWKSPTTLTLALTPSSNLEIADIDGDGKSEMFEISQGANIIHWKTYSYDINSSQRIYESKNGWIHIATIDKYKIIDFNGNGKKDLLITNNTYNYIYEFDGENMVLISSGTNILTNNDIIYPADFNGDGKTDFLKFKNSIWEILISNGKNYITSSHNLTLQNLNNLINISDHNILICDINGDGKSDILEVYNFRENGSSFNTKLNLFVNTYNLNFNKTEKTNINSAYYENNFGIGDFNGDGKTDFLLKKYYDDIFTVFLMWKENRSNLVKSITNGFNLQTSFTYSPISEGGSFYSKQTNATFPIIDFKGALYTVKTITVPDGIGGINTTSYSYEGAKIHLQGRGFLGFSKITAINNITNNKIIQTFEINPTFYTASLKMIETYNNTTLLSRITNTNTLIDYGYKRIFPYVSSVVSFNNILGITQTTSYTYDNYGNQTRIYVDNPSGYEDITNEYISAVGWGPLNRVSKTTNSKSMPMSTAFTRIIQYNYDTKGNLLNKTIDPGKGKAVTTTYELNNIGFPTKITISASGITSRYSSYYYDSRYRYVRKIVNALNQYESKTCDTKTGNILTETDIDGKTTTYTYDGFGKLKTTLTPQGHTITNIINWTGTLTQQMLYYTSISIPGKPSSGIVYDFLGRVTKESTNNFNNSNVSTYTEYNNKGQVFRVSEPTTSSNKIWTEYAYDNYGRQTSINSKGLITSYSYSGKTTTVTNPTGQSSAQTVNDWGDVTKVVDNGGTITYGYKYPGMVQYITAVGSVTSITYDEYGNQISLTDPNAGLTSYSYNALGELTSQTDARNIVTTMQYDILGRTTSKSNTDGTISYSYISTGNGVGQISSITNGSNQQTFVYDEYGRTSQITETISGQNYVTSFGYDTYGNNTTITYPSGFSILQTFYGNGLGQGYLQEVKRADDNTSIWKRSTENDLGQPTKYILGNGLQPTLTYNSYNFLINEKIGTIQEFDYSFNPQTGNVAYRKNVLQNLTENFTYDNLNRLTSFWIGGSNPTPTNINYATNGNITSKSDAGTYTYDATKKHAITGITDNPSTIPLLQQDITYNSYGKATNITEGTKSLTLTYGIDNQRIKTEYFENSILKKTKIFVGNYEKVTENGVTKEFHYISGAYGLVAVYIKTGATGAMYYIHQDHLGSITAITNQSGAIVERHSFDAWGRERNPLNWTFTSVPTTQLFERGYTGHEHLPAFGLINMNGRMYDPVLGRMLSPDNYIQAAGYSQNYNRYSYCYNNPLKYTDPSGNWIDYAIVGGLGFAYGYTSYGIMNDNWGWKAAGSGLLYSGIFTLSYFTGGYTGSANDIAVRYGINMIASQSFSTLMPSTSIPIGNSNFSISMNPGIGNVSASLNYNSGKTDIGLGFGAGGNSIAWGASASYNDYGGSYYRTYYGNKSGPDKNNNNQIVGGIGLKLNNISFRIENDKFGDGSDRWRSNAVELGYKNYVLGTNLYNNDPEGEGQGIVDKPDRCGIYNTPNKNGEILGAWVSGKVYSSPLYVGYRSGSLITRFGYNHPSAQDMTQNKIHRFLPIGRQNYYVDYSEFSYGPYLYSGYYNPYSLW